MDRSSPFWERCARHTNSYPARTLQTAFYCDDCTVRLTREAFNLRPPVYHGSDRTGFCGLCGGRRTVALRQWFVCGICWNVILAYQKSIAASRAVRAIWGSVAAPSLGLRMDETEPVRLSPFARAQKTKRASAGALRELDFCVFDGAAPDSRALFHIELKSGPGSIEDIKEFQLDVNDFNDVAGVANNTGLPVYLWHVQTAFEYDLPTRTTVARAAWWTDAHTLTQHLLRVSGRRHEDKRAAYFGTGAFQPLATFGVALKTAAYARLAEQLRQAPLVFLE